MCLSTCYLTLVILDFVSTHIALKRGLEETNFIIVWIRDRWNWIGHLVFSFVLGVGYLWVVKDADLLAIMDVTLGLIVLRNFWNIYGRT